MVQDRLKAEVRTTKSLFEDVTPVVTCRGSCTKNLVSSAIPAYTINLRFRWPARQFRVAFDAKMKRTMQAVG
jgi:hypothetical protein